MAKASRPIPARPPRPATTPPAGIRTSEGIATGHDAPQRRLEPLRGSGRQQVHRRRSSHGDPRPPSGPPSASPESGPPPGHQDRATAGGQVSRHHRPAMRHRAACRGGAVIRSTSQPVRPGRPPASHHHQDIEAEAATRTSPDKGSVILTLSAESASADISHNWLISKGPLSLRLVWSPIQSPTSCPKAPAGPDWPEAHAPRRIGGSKGGSEGGGNFSFLVIQLVTF